MSLSKTIVKKTEHSITYLLEEDGTAAGELPIAVASDCEDGALKTHLETAVADQAAARALLLENCTVSVHARSLTPDGATGGANLVLDCDDNSTVFELNATAVKDANADTGKWIVKIQLDHSLTR